MKTPGLGAARKVAICLGLIALLLGQLAIVVHGPHFDTDDSHESEICAICVAAASLDSDHTSCVRLLSDPLFRVEHQLLPVDTRQIDSTRPLDLSARSPPLA